MVRVARRTYLGTREYVKTRIRRWPPEGIETYRRLTGPRSSELLAEGRAPTRGTVVLGTVRGDVTACHGEGYVSVGVRFSTQENRVALTTHFM